jgi:hypothetical protein
VSGSLVLMVMVASALLPNTPRERKSVERQVVSSFPFPSAGGGAGCRDQAGG